jgi:hypothetical protein
MRSYPNIARLQVSDRLLLNSHHPSLIRGIRRYSDFGEALEAEDPLLIAPGLPSHEPLRALRAICAREIEALGVVALAVAPDKDVAP